MLILDEQRIERNLRGLAQEKYAHEVNAWTMEQIRGDRIIVDGDDSPINPERQMGHMLPNAAAFEQVMTRCSPNFVYEESISDDGKRNPTKKRLFFQIPGGDKRYICLYEAFEIPEYSIMLGRWEWEPDPDFALGGRQLHRSEVRGTPLSLRDAYDLIKELGPENAAKQLLQMRQDSGLDDPAYRPGFRKTLKVYREAIRGWRTVMVRAVQSGFVSLYDIKREIDKLVAPGAERASWGVRTGQIDPTTSIGF